MAATITATSARSRRRARSGATSTSTSSAVQAMQAENGGGGARNPRKEAKDFILKMLDSGSALAAEIEEAAEDEGISLRTLKNAKRDLKIVSNT